MNKTVFSAKQMATLAKYQGDLSNAYKGNFVSAVTSGEFREVADILSEVTGSDYGSNHSCGHCVLDLFKTAGRLYFQQKEAESQKPKKTLKPITAPKPQQKKTQTKKK